MMRRGFLLGCFCCACLLLAFTSCEHKDLEEWPEETPTRALVRFNVDWSDFTEDDDLTGMTVAAYNQSTGKVTRVITNTTAYADLALEPGFYTMLVFNQTVDEYVSLGFQNMDNILEAALCATKQDTRWYTRAEEFIAQEPAWFARDMVTDVEITQEMLERSPYSSRTRTRMKSRQALGDDQAIIVKTFKPKNIIHILQVTVDIENFKSLRAVRGAVSNMAGGMSLYDLKGSNNRVTMLLENWNMIATTALEESRGQINTAVRCFGLPEDRTGLAEDNELYLELLLANGEIVKYEIPVGDMMWLSEDPEHPLYIDIQLPLPEALPDIDISGGGMGVNVGTWQEVKADVPI